jgi:hypothetical protein
MANATWEVLNARSHRRDSAYLECENLIHRDDVKARGVNTEKLLVALKQAWDGTRFRCYHTGLPLTTTDAWSPLFLRWEHLETVHGDEIAIVAAVVRGLAAELPSVDFLRVCQALRERLPNDDRPSMRNIPIRWRLRAHRLKSARTPRARN